MNKVLVVAAHPDDEVLGCGATMARHAASGDEVRVVLLAEGITSRKTDAEHFKTRQQLDALKVCANRASEILGVSNPTLHGLPDNRMDTLPLLEIVKILEDHIEEFHPDIVYTHYVEDLNIDHRITHNSVITACRPVPGNPVKTLLFFEVPSSTEWLFSPGANSFKPDWLVDVTDYMDKKIESLMAYAPEMRAWPHPRSIEAVEHLARWRGATVGAGAAEAFMLGFHIR